MCITEEEIQKLAVEASEATKQGKKISKSLTATAPKHVIQKQTDSSTKMSKNKKKKLKQKIKKQLQKHQQELDDGANSKPLEGENLTDQNILRETITENSDVETVGATVENMDTDIIQNADIKTEPESTQNEIIGDSRSQPIASPYVNKIKCNGDIRMVSVDRETSTTETTDDVMENVAEDRSRIEERKKLTSPGETDILNGNCLILGYQNCFVVVVVVVVKL